jgi:predicted metalloprotease
MSAPTACTALLRRVVAGAVLTLHLLMAGGAGAAPAPASTRPAATAGAATAVVGRLGEFAAPVATVAGPLPSDEQLGEFLAAVENDLTATWTRLLDARGVAPSVRLALFHIADTPVLQTACGPVPSEVGPFFCGADLSIYLGVEFARAVWSHVGDMAVVQVVAHEFGHDVQQLLGVVPTAGNPAFELQADCLGGTYARDAGARGLLEPGDVDEARRLSRLVGDEGPSEDPHGSPDQREQAFLDGYAGGLSACLAP